MLNVGDLGMREGVLALVQPNNGRNSEELYGLAREAVEAFSATAANGGRLLLENAQDIGSGPMLAYINQRELLALQLLNFLCEIVRQSSGNA